MKLIENRCDRHRYTQDIGIYTVYIGMIIGIYMDIYIGIYMGIYIGI